MTSAYDKAVHWKPDAILLSLELAQVYGPAIIGQIRARIADVRIALVCDSATDPVARSYLQHGVQSLLSKPLTVESVRRKVDRLLGRRSALAIPVQVVA
jgi:CheY-like chemotaxis protein